MRGIQARLSSAGGVQRSDSTSCATGDPGDRIGFRPSIVEWAFGSSILARDDGCTHHFVLDSSRPEGPARQYIDHGLGQAVLALEHRKKEMESADADSKEKVAKIISAAEKWINAQKWSFLVDVNVGAWSGKTARQMSEEAEILDFYNYVYTPFTQCVHSTWYHVGCYNSGPSGSPLTGQLWMPRIAESISDIWNLHLAAKYLDKTFCMFDEKALNRSPSSEIREWIYGEIQNRFGSNDCNLDSAWLC